MNLHVVSDPHGHRDELVAALQAASLLDAGEHWSGARERLWFLGDFFDRGPDGVGIVELVMRLEREASEVGGHVGAVLGNHEVLALGMHAFGPAALPRRFGAMRERSFLSSWVVNGGNPEDQRRLTGRHLAWLRALPALALVDGWLLMHSDTTEYFGWGNDIEEVNATVGAALTGALPEVWDVWRRLTDRYEFSEDAFGVEAARQMLTLFGGTRIVHGHSIIATLTDSEPEETVGPYSYADGLVLAIDGGLYAGGPLLVVDLEPTTAGTPGTRDVT